MKTLWAGLCLLAVFATCDCFAVVEPFYTKDYGNELGEFQRQGSTASTHHGVQGTVYIADERTIIIDRFAYDGLAPDAFIWAGSSNQPDATGEIIQLDSFNSPRPLGTYSYTPDSEPLLLKLPDGKTITDYRWISIWCRTARASFAEVYISPGFQIPGPNNIGAINSAETTSSSVTVVNNRQIRIEGLNYRGGCGQNQISNAYYWVGSGTPSSNGRRIASESRNFRVERIPFQGVTNGDVTLTLSKPATVKDIDYVGIWCERSGQSHGHVSIPSDLNVPPFVEEPYYGSYVGDFDVPGQSVSEQDRALGSVYAADENVLVITDFTVGGLQDVVLLGGATSGGSVGNGDILTLEGSTNRLREYNHERVVVDLPSGKTVADYSWIAVWNRQSQTSLGTVNIPRSFTAPSQKSIGTLGFPRRVHNVFVDEVVIIDHQTILLKNMDYDANGPDAFMWPITPDGVGWIASWQLEGGEINDQQIPNNGRRWNDQTVYVHLPDWMTVFDITSLTVWCRRFTQNFGAVAIPTRQELANIPANVGRSMQTGPEPTPVYEEQCEVLSDDEFHANWQIDSTGQNIDITLEGRVEPGTYMAFGISGSTTSTAMIGSDVAVAWIDQSLNSNVVDYYLDSRQQCVVNIGQGACPDSISTAPSSREDITMTGATYNNGVASISYRRALNTGDIYGDKVIPNDSPVYISWAIGPINPDGRVVYHSKRIEGNKQIEFSRQGASTCPSLSGGTGPDLTPWQQAEIIAGNQITTFRADIGQAGGVRGYEGLTGRAGWGIAWYINDELIPILTLTRGVTYTFEVNGGNDPSLSASYHPFYITNDPNGGFSQIRAQDRQNLVIYAGPVDGSLCEWQSNGVASPNDFDTFAEYRDTSLERVCVSTFPQPGILQWTPDESTPDEVYYQCFTHRFLGWKINVVDPPVVNPCDSRPCVNGGTCAPAVLDEYYICRCLPGYTGAQCQTNLNPCNNRPCQNGGTCLPSGTSFTCTCPPGYSGNQCQTIENPCNSGPCQNGGACFPSGNSYFCNCQPGYSGNQCQNVENPCNSGPCQNGGACFPSGSSYVCNCQPGYNGNQCQNVENPCNSGPCQNGGACFPSGSSYFCNCQPGYNGNQCQNVENPCNSGPCQNGGACFPSGSSYFCNCQPGFNGNQCQNVADPCNSTPCQNGGVCLSSGSMFICSCPLGFIGIQCQILNRCDFQPCQNGGTCTQSGSSFICRCADGYMGDECQTRVNPCNSGPCENGGACFPLGSSYFCSCQDGYTGNQCQNFANQCDFRPCQNGGTCTPSGSSYTCTCPPGYNGRQCLNYVNPCNIQPCRNGGTCLPSGVSYTCTCQPGYNGDQCQIISNLCDTRPCQNGGTCLPSGNRYTCTCPPGYIGAQCQTSQCPDGQQYTPCLTDPCAVTSCPVFPDARCVSNYCGGCNAMFYDIYGAELTQQQCSAICPPNVQVVNCFADPCMVTDCAYPNAICRSNYCGGCNAVFYDSNGVELTRQQCTANCPTGVPIFNCITDPCSTTSCPAYPDARCVSNSCGGCNAVFYDSNGAELRLQQCTAISCEYEGIMYSEGQNRRASDGCNTCSCESGNWLCSLRPCVQDPCDSRPCQNGAACFSLPSQFFICRCEAGFTGVQCETNIDECASNPCVNGQCFDGYNTYDCTCNDGWTGRNCNEPTSGSCPPDAPLNNCFVDPCTVTYCSAYPNARCVSNYCGGCNAIFYDENGAELTCIAITCAYEDNMFTEGQTRQASDGCNTCSCANGNWICTLRECGGCIYNGAQFSIGQSRPADDGCNTCYCDLGGNWGCTEIACGGCIYSGARFSIGQPRPADDGCNTCFCNLGGNWGCTEIACDVDECASNPCVNGQCFDGDFTYDCTCNDGWAGSNCDEQLCPDGLLPFPCQYDACNVVECPLYPDAICRTNRCSPCTADFYVRGNKVDCIQAGTCPDGSQPFACTTDPCSVVRCANPNAICRANYCGGCNAEFYDANGNSVDCTQPGTCPDGSQPIPCFINPCDVSVCPSNPDARCVPNYCGGCNADYYDEGNNIVDCTQDPRCPLVCTLDYTPVCASDRQTYSNACFLGSEIICNNKPGLSIAYLGECQSTGICEDGSSPLDCSGVPNPCQRGDVNECPAFPRAQCRPNTCDGCNAAFYDERDNVVDCTPIVTCPDGSRPFPCVSDPCVDAPCPANPNARCVPNYCGGCNAEFYDDNRNRVDCTQTGSCPDGSRAFRCDASPCFGAQCPANPNARCVPNFCGGCNAEFYDERNNRVDCTQTGTCPPDVAVYNCLNDPCSISSCPAYPDARCVSNSCGGCNAVFYSSNGAELTIQQCTDCTFACTDDSRSENAPVCGSDGQTYPNLCLLFIEKLCRKPTPPLAKHYDGQCSLTIEEDNAN